MIEHKINRTHERISLGDKIEFKEFELTHLKLMRTDVDNRIKSVEEELGELRFAKDHGLGLS